MQGKALSTQIDFRLHYYMVEYGFLMSNFGLQSKELWWSCIKMEPCMGNVLTVR